MSDAAQWVTDEAVQAAYEAGGHAIASRWDTTRMLTAAAPFIRRAVLLEAADWLDTERRNAPPGKEIVSYIVSADLLRRMAVEADLPRGAMRIIRSDDPGWHPATTVVGADFYEEDEPVEKIVAAFEAGEKRKTAPPSGQDKQRWRTAVNELRWMLNQCREESGAEIARLGDQQDTIETLSRLLSDCEAAVERVRAQLQEDIDYYGGSDDPMSMGRVIGAREALRALDGAE